MKHIITISILVLLLAATVTSAQRGRGNCRWNNNVNNTGNSGRMYDTETVKTITGEIEEINYLTHGRTQGVHVMVKTSDGNVEAHLGPDWAINDQKINLEKGVKVTLQGSMVAYNDGEAMSVASMEINGNEYTLRDNNGFPVWSRSGQGGRGWGRGCRGNFNNRRI